MIRNLLLLLGESAAGTAAAAYARRLALAQGASITSLAGVDLSFIEAPMLGTIGAAAYHARMESGLRAQAEEAQGTLTAAFEADCARDGIAMRPLSFEGDPAAQAAATSATCDLVIAGHDVTFRGTGSERNSDTLSALLQATPRPVVVCPDAVPPEGAVLVAYDGSLPAMRALQLFVLTGCWQGRRVTVLSVDAEADAAARVAADAQAFLTLHGYEVTTKAVTSGVSPAEVIDLQLAEGYELLVMGAYGRRGLKEFIFGSTTETVLGSPPTCLFLYH